MYEHEKEPCAYCGEMIGKKNMTRHIDQKHTENRKRKYQCTLCGKGFLSPQHLQDHMNIHTGAKPYMCKYCGSTYASMGNWRMHERTVHLGHKREDSHQNSHFKSGHHLKIVSPVKTEEN